MSIIMLMIYIVIGIGALIALIGLLGFLFIGKRKLSFRYLTYCWVGLGILGITILLIALINAIGFEI